MEQLTYLNDLDEEQRRAVVESVGRSIVIAGPGSGKTRVITYKLLHLLKSGVKPSQILLVTFTRAASNEMIERAKRLTGMDLEDLTAGTFHHVCNLLLRKYALRVGLLPNFTILDEDDSTSLIRHTRTKVLERLGAKKNFPSHTVLRKLFSYSANTLTSLRESILKIEPKFAEHLTEIEEIYKEYCLEKRSQNCVDYDDLLVYAIQLLENNQDVLMRESSKYQWILVDEFQDTNILQLKLIELLSTVHKNVVVVADDSQSIYSFRGARFENVNDFLKVKGTKLFKVQTNYRSTEKIVKLVNSMIPEKSVPKVLKAVKPDGMKPKLVQVSDAQEEAIFVTREILKLIEHGFEPSQIAVLYRSHSHSLELQLELAKQKIDFKILSGLRFTETAHIKDVLAFLRILQNPKEKVSWIRIAKLFPGIGAKTASKLADHASTSEQTDPAKILEELGEKKDSIAQMESIFESMQRQSRIDTMISVLNDMFYSEYLLNNYPDHLERQQDINRLIEIAARYRSLERFLTDLTVSSDVNDDETTKNSLTLTTVHQAKGLEWEVVFVLSVNPGDFPSYYAIMDNNIDEEERIFYVAITRAKQLLYIIRHGYSRFSSMYWLRGIDFAQRIPSHLVEELWFDSQG